MDARQTARNVFAQPKELGADGKWRQQSSHYIVGRDGTVVQCVRHKDVAFHANTENSYTIGIEHNARQPGDTTLTDIQYWKSAKLVVWLGQQLGLPIFDRDRWHLQGHSEIDLATTHTMCPQRALNWDTYMLAMADVRAAAEEGTCPCGFGINNKGWTASAAFTFGIISASPVRELATSGSA